MKILITGATGFIGRRLALQLFKEGHDLIIATRQPKSAALKLGLPCEVIAWDSLKDPMPFEALEKAEAVIHLAGESIAGGHWTRARKNAIRDSRCLGTQNLVKGILAATPHAPQVLISTSAIGFYGDRGDEILSEKSTKGAGFLSDVCKEWEDSALFAQTPQTRVALLRLGVVLGQGGGALPQMAAPFLAGLGATLGSGKQWMSWVHVDDVIATICLALKDERMAGAINVVSPEPVTNQDFTQALAQTLNKKARITVPEFVLRATLGEMSSILLESARVTPDRLKAYNFSFRFNDLKSALAHALAHNHKGSPDSVFETWQFIPQPKAKVFEYFCEAKNLEALTPPWLHFSIRSQSTAQITEGTEFEYQLSVHGLPMRWKSKIETWKPTDSFTDIQLKGPYAKWHHSHFFEDQRGGTLMRDLVHYQLPLGGVGALAGGRFVTQDVAAIFEFRKQKAAELWT